MPRYAAFLRGVNLGARRRAGSDDLRSCFEGIGLEGVATFRTSGNVVFEAGREARAKLTGRIEKALAEALGYDVTVFLRTAAELEAIAAREPFPAKLVDRSKGKLQVALLPKKPSAGRPQAGARDGHGRGPARVRRARALLAAKRRNARRGPRPGGRGEADRALDDAHQGHPRAAPFEVLRRRRWDPQTFVRCGATVDFFGQPANHAGTTSRTHAADRRRHPGVRDRRRSRRRPRRSESARRGHVLQRPGLALDGAVAELQPARPGQEGRPDLEDRPRAQGTLARALHAPQLRRQGAPPDRPGQGTRRGPHLHRAARPGHRLQPDLPGRRTWRGRGDARRGTTTSPA